MASWISLAARLPVASGEGRGVVGAVQDEHRCAELGQLGSDVHGGGQGLYGGRGTGGGGQATGDEVLHRLRGHLVSGPAEREERVGARGEERRPVTA